MRLAMGLEVNGVSIETTEDGYLVDHSQWNEDVCKAIAQERRNFIYLILSPSIDYSSIFTCTEPLLTEFFDQIFKICLIPSCFFLQNIEFEITPIKRSKTNIRILKFQFFGNIRPNIWNGCPCKCYNWYIV